MTKKENIDDPNSCWNTAADDDIVFILKQKDLAAPDTIREWIGLRIALKLNAKNDAKLTSALTIAQQMESSQKFDGTYPTEQNRKAGEHEKGTGV